MLIEAGALKVDTEGLPWPLVGALFVGVHVMGPILWAGSWFMYQLRGESRE